MLGVCLFVGCNALCGVGCLLCVVCRVMLVD